MNSRKPYLKSRLTWGNLSRFAQAGNHVYDSSVELPRIRPVVSGAPFAVKAVLELTRFDGSRWATLLIVTV